MRRIALSMVVLLLGADLLAWGVHVAWREAAIEKLDPVAREIDVLARRVAEDDAWIEQNRGDTADARLEARISARDQRLRTHDVLVDAYNEQVRYLYARFYLAPLPAPHPPLKPLLAPRVP